MFYSLILMTETSLLTPFQFLFAKLSLVNTTSLCQYHIIFFIFKGILSLEIRLFLMADPFVTKARYIECTEKFLC
jgi:hypothetical protein